MSDGINTLIATGDIEVRDHAKREIGMFIVPWDTEVETAQGREMFKRGAFAGIDPRTIRLRMEHQDPPAGKGIELDERDDGAYAAFKVSKTARGDEILELAADGVSNGASVGFMEVPDGTSIEVRNGRRVRVHRRVNLREVSTTWQPAYERAAVTYIRSTTEGEEAPMSDVAAPDNGAIPEIVPVPQVEPPNTALFDKAMTSMNQLTGRLEQLEERSRSNFTIPAGEPEQPKPDRGHWMNAVLRMMDGERVDLQQRALADIITTDNIGVVPDTYSKELIGVIDPRRPFMQTTRHLNTPSTGMSLIVPRIVTRPTVGIQATEKTQLTSTATAIDTVTFNAVSKGGAGDISLQLLKRSSPEFLGLYMELLAEAYAVDSEQEAVEAVLASGINSGGALDPEDLSLGGAWSDAFDAVRNGPNHIWMSSTAVGLFIDAKASGTNAPLYSNIAANFTAASGAGGTISGLQPVHVPALNSTDIDVLVGPSSGFAWAEDGTYTLQVDVPAKAGRDVALIGMLWFAPLYPASFTAYSVAGGGS